MLKKNLLRVILWCPVAVVAAACASIGNPSGGPRDEQPPRFVRSTPGPDAVNFNGNEVNIYFDELVNLKDAFSKVIVSPPMATMPRVSALGRRVNVRFPDSLLSNTTYTIDFGNSIEDNNESNKLENFSLTFSTGPTVDSLGMSGIVLSAYNLEPMQGKLVGLHSNLSDSAFRKLPFDYVGRTDSRGRFSLSGLRPGKYRVYAIDDPDNNLMYSSLEEEIAFYDMVVEPHNISAVAHDTIRDLRTGEIDSIVDRIRSIKLPNDILLRSFTSPFRQQYISGYERPDSSRLNFRFGSRAINPPSFRILGAEHLENWAVAERNSTNDTITLWLKPRSLVAADTLRIIASFEVTDSLRRPVLRTDTLRMIFDRKTYDRNVANELKESAKKLKKTYGESADSAALAARNERLGLLNVDMLSSSVIEMEKPILFETSTPLQRMDTLSFHLEAKAKKDSVWTRLPMPPIELPDSLQPRRFSISYPWKYDTQYRLRVDSLGMQGIYGQTNATLSQEFSTRAEGDYSSLTLRLRGVDSTVPMFVELLSGDNPIAAVPVTNGVAMFKYLLPGKYYVRMYEDYNGNGQWDAGDFDAGLQPEVSFYYPKQVNLKKNWSKDETWDVFATMVDRQKPEAILKNRPEQRKQTPRSKKNEQEEEEEDS
ncbi:MAG: Ig-like domain-containing domain [Muribaculum sp.]|nr:Ig-like domain-containing domain [Muribaculum sp.]